MRASLLYVVIAGVSAVAAVTACSNPPVATEADIKHTTQASSVTIEMFDKVGNELGSCSGTLIAKDLVLTAGHCAAGVATWKIDAKGADAKSTSTHAVTPWKAFGSNLSHPDHSDLALIVLETPITLDKYPGIATTPLGSGAKALHFHRTSAAAAAPITSTLSLTNGRSQGFRLEYLAKVADGNFLDTGGAIVDPTTGDIHGVVSGKGTVTNLLHIARIDNYAKWITKAQSCSAATGGGITTKTYPGSSSSSGGSSSWGGSSGDWGGYGGGGTGLDAAAPPPYGGASSGGASSSGASSSGASSGDGGTSSGGTSSGGTSSSGSSGSSGASSGDDGTGGTSSSSCPSTPSCEGSACPGTDGPGTPGGLNPGGDDGDTTGGASSGGSSSGGTTGGASSSGGTSGAGGNAPGTPTDVCPGPPNCPDPDSQACVGAACGGCAGVGGCADTTIDYGSCASCGTGGGSSGSPVLR